MQQNTGAVMARHIKGDLIGKKSLLLLLKLVSLPGIVHRSLALFIGVLLLSESAAAAPRRIALTIAQQPAATSQDATSASADRAFQEGDELSERYALCVAQSYQHSQIQNYQHSYPTEADCRETLRQAIEKWKEALQLYRALCDKAKERKTLAHLRVAYDLLGEQPGRMGMRTAQEPAATFQDATSAAAQRALDEGFLLFVQRNAQPTTAKPRESLQQAIKKLEEAASLYQAAGNKNKEGEALVYMSVVYRALGEEQKADDSFNQALSLNREAYNSLTEAATSISIGGVYFPLGEQRRVLNNLYHSLIIYGWTDNREGKARTLNSIGAVYSELGEKQKALDYYNQSLTLARAVSDVEGEAVTLNNIGVVYDFLGEKQKALDYYNQSLPLTRAVCDKTQEGVTLQNMGMVYSDLGEKQKALDYLNQSLSLTRAVGNNAEEASTLTRMGRVYSDLGEKQKALDCFNQSLPLARAVGNKVEVAVTLRNMGKVYSDLGEKYKALNYYNQSLTLARVLGDMAGVAVTLYNIAYLESDRGNLNEALTQIEIAIAIIENLRTKIATQQLRASYFATVQDYYKLKINLLMQLHKTNPTQGYDALALHANERARARSFLEILAEARADIRQGVDLNLLKQERTLQQQINALEQSRVKLLEGQYTNKQLDDIKQQSESLFTQLEQVEGLIRVRSPRYANLKYPEALTLQQIQKEVLDDNTILLEYSLGKERSYLWAVTKTGITSYELPKRADIEAAAQAFYAQLKSEAGSLDEGMKLSQMLLAPVATQLGQKRLLIVSDGALQSIPFAALPIPENSQTSLLPTSRQEINLLANSPSRLKTTETLINSPLQRTLAMSQGFKPLADENTYSPLLLQHEIVSLPSASTIAVLRSELKDRKPAAKTLVAIADPVFTRDDDRIPTKQPQPNNPTIPTQVKRSASDIGVTLDRLKYSRTEAEQILALVPASQRQQAFDFAASRGTATRPDLAQYRMVHLATHGLLNNVHPELSGVVLSLVDEKGTDADGFLRLHDIFNLNLPAELVVLSACETGLGKDVQGEGLVGLTRGFMYAGAKRVVVSLWSVNDSATAEMMKTFYQQMLSTGKNPVAALRAAQLEMWKTQQWKAPYYWAAFVVQGEWQ